MGDPNRRISFNIAEPLASEGEVDIAAVLHSGEFSCPTSRPQLKLRLKRGIGSNRCLPCGPASGVIR